MAVNLPSILQVVLPRRRMNPRGTSNTGTFDPNQSDQVLTAPQYREHLQDIFTTRASEDSRVLLNDLFRQDTDLSATVHAYLTLADTKPIFKVYDQEGNLDREGQQLFQALLLGLTVRRDYSTGFAFTHSLDELSADLRYMILLRGGIACELVFDKTLVPVEVRHVDLAEIQWYERQPGLYKPVQVIPATGEEISLDIPNFFVNYYRQNPTEIYTYSPFVSAINTIASRQQVINDLYRIMQKTGYPRMEITVVEEVLSKNVPENMRNNPRQAQQWKNARLQEIANSLAGLRPDSAYVHTDAVQARILNEGGPGKSMDAKSIIDVLNAQNQAALKTMATIIGRGETGVNTASVEARVFSMSADSINVPLASLYSEMFTLALRLQGYLGYVECTFAPAELRPSLELEPQMTMKQSRLLEELSLGLISDDTYYLEMHGMPRPEGTPDLSGTGFRDKNTSQVDAGSISPNSDPLGRSISTNGDSQARSNSNRTANG